MNAIETLSKKMLRLRRLFGAWKEDARTRRSIYQTEIGGLPIQVGSQSPLFVNEPDFDYFTHLARDAKRVLDVGSNVGYYGVYAALLPNISQVAFIDPSPWALSQAALNLFLNSDGTKGSFISAFAGSSCGKNVDFYTIGSSVIGTAYPSSKMSAKRLGAIIKVPSVTLDYIVEQLGWMPDLIKIDTEGAEIEMLKGCEHISGSMDVRYIIEVHSTPGISAHDRGIWIVEWAKKNNYFIWALEKNNFYKLTGNEAPKQSRYHLILSKSDVSQLLIHN